MEKSNSVGERIRDLRVENGLSQKEFGQALGISLPTVNRIERGHRTPDTDLIVKMNQTFDLDLVWLLTGSGAEGNSGNKIPLLKEIPPHLSDITDFVALQLNFPDLPTGSLAIRVSGDEMLPTIREGDYIIFVSREIGPGDLVLYRDDWNKPKVRRFREENGGELIAENPEFPRLPYDERKKVGKVLQVIRQLNF